MKRTREQKLSGQMKRKISNGKKEIKEKSELVGNTETMISTGSTLLDLAISGGRVKGGGIPGGIMFEAFGPSSSGKTVLLCEIAGAIQRQGGSIQFNDPEARLNKQFASMFDFDLKNVEVHQPNTVTEVFANIRKWEPETKAPIHSIMTDSLAALSTDLEMDSDEGDKMGMRRGKEFSEGFRKTARILKQNNYIMGCSNQIRDNLSTHGEKFSVPGGKAIAFYASLRLRFFSPEKIKKTKTVQGKEVHRIIGTKVRVEVYKNSIDAPYRDAFLYIIFDYGIDDVRANLQFVKDFTKHSVYTLNSETLDKSMEKAIAIIEEDELEDELKTEVIELWTDIQSKFESNRKKKKR